MKSSRRFELIFLLLLLILINSRFIKAPLLGGDTYSYLHQFKTSYNELFFYNQFSQWSPYGTYGQSNLNYNLLCISSMDFLGHVPRKVIRYSQFYVPFPAFNYWRGNPSS